MSQLDRRQALKLFAGVGAAAAVPGLAACSGSSLSGNNTNQPSGPVKIGLLVPQSGVYKVIGDDLTQGFKLYLQLHGEKLGGRTVELVFADEGETGDSGKAAAEK
ncbi:MAG TPA: ABC transporter substrate-binding protein, partial [Micromonosporaceae bacterium]|nr:ABC transporter substrate-binding protein [Micromonosporaceae bacterium]